MYLYRMIYALTISWNNEITKMFNDYLPGIIDALKIIADNSNGKLDAKSLGKALAVIAKSFTNRKSGLNRS